MPPLSKGEGDPNFKEFKKGRTWKKLEWVKPKGEGGKDFKKERGKPYFSSWIFEIENDKNREFYETTLYAAAASNTFLLDNYCAYHDGSKECFYSDVSIMTIIF